MGYMSADPSGPSTVRSPVYGARWPEQNKRDTANGIKSNLNILLLARRERVRGEREGGPILVSLILGNINIRFRYGQRIF